MKNQFLNALLILLTTTLYGGCYTELSPPKPSNNLDCKLQGKVIKVTDGDTVNVLDAEKQIHKIRLAGIDAPELGQPYGKAARKFLAKHVNQKTVCIDWQKRDRYGRLVGKVMFNNTDMNLEQVKTGYAWHYKKYQREQTSADRKLYAQAENTARVDTIGLWSEPSPINPSDWRKGRKATVTNPIPLSPENFICGYKRFCGQMGSCSEAYFYLQRCGLSKLDGNSDGIPCNKLCNKTE